MMDKGCQITRFERTFESAWKIIDMTKDTSDAIHEFLLEGEESSKSYVYNFMGEMTHRMILDKWT